MLRFRTLVWFVPALTLLLVVSGTLREVGAADLSYAGVVVRHDDARISYAFVGFEEAEISGIELLRRTGLDVVTVSFGGLGEGVCSIDAQGCPTTECRQRVCQGPSDADPFWQYFRQASPGDWQALALGASATKVRDGDIDGWSWTPHDANLPPLELDEVARLAGYDGASFDNVHAGEPGVAMQRQGGAIEDAGQPIAIYFVAGIILLAAAAMVCWLAAHRRRIVRVT